MTGSSSGQPGSRATQFGCPASLERMMKIPGHPWLPLRGTEQRGDGTEPRGGETGSFWRPHHRGKIQEARPLSFPSNVEERSSYTHKKNLFLVTLESLQKFYYLRFCQLGQIFNFSFLKNRTDLEVVISCRSGPETPVWRCFIALVFQFSKLSEKNIFMKKVF